MKARFARSAARLFRYRRVSTLGFLLTLIASSSAGAQQGTPEQRRACTPRRLPSLRRRDPERPCDYRLPAPAEVELEFGLRGGVPAAVSLERSLTFTSAASFFSSIRFNNARMRAASAGLLTIYNEAL